MRVGGPVYAPAADHVRLSSSASGLNNLWFSRSAPAAGSHHPARRALSSDLSITPKACLYRGSLPSRLLRVEIGLLLRVWAS